MNQKENKSAKKHLFLDHIFGAVFTSLHLFLAYLGGTLVIQHLINMFLPNHVITTEAPCVAGGLLVVVLGIFGSYGALHYMFLQTKLKKFFPGYWN
ncbi:hypothetical protein [Lactobacillus amylovorus]|jgi:pheromone shutdown protein TraB|uniref:hypothetical protein n=1 Tax=Lactobacillus amylovorus TaxID=1604 RepID=UPI0007048F83|nr:hypothetical protein [Lactobacillus amylovorus]